MVELDSKFKGNPSLHAMQCRASAIKLANQSGKDVEIRSTTVLDGNDSLIEQNDYVVIDGHRVMHLVSVPKD